MALATRRILQSRRPTSIPRGCIRPVVWCRASPACRSARKAVIGENAFAPRGRHPSARHAAGIARPTKSCGPEDVGRTRNDLVLGNWHTGRHAFRERVKELGFELDDLELNRVFEEFKALADRKKELFDGDIEAIVLRAGSAAAGPWNLEHLDVEAHSGAGAQATVRLKHTDGRVIERQAPGDGPVDAAYKAIVLATGVAVTVRKFEVHAVTIGEDAQGEAILYVEHNGRSYRGSSVSTNIIEAAGHALLEVINRIELSAEERPPRSTRHTRAERASWRSSTI